VYGDILSSYFTCHSFDDIDLVKIMYFLEKELDARYKFGSYSDIIIPMLANVILEIPVKKDENSGKDEENQNILCKSNA
jgi:hypothetical protein